MKTTSTKLKPSALVDTRVIYCGDNLEQLAKLPPACEDQRGFFVGFGFSSDAERECAAFHKRTGRIIKLITVQEILDEQHVQKM